MMFKPKTFQQAIDWAIIQASKAQMAFDDGRFETANALLLDARQAIIQAAGFATDAMAKKVVSIRRDA